MTSASIASIVLTATATAGATTYAALSARSQLFGKVLIAGSDPGQLALTYDDGPNPAATPQLLELLARHSVRATFFLIGRFVRSEPALAREIAAAGHLIGNHTMTHPWLAWQSVPRIRAELTDCNAVLEDTLGKAIHLFRPPHGARRPAVLRIARELGLTPINWNVIANDWEPVDAATILNRVQQGIDRNQRSNQSSNILLHDGGDQRLEALRLPTVHATRLLLERQRGSSNTFVTCDTWLRAADSS